MLQRQRDASDSVDASRATAASESERSVSPKPGSYDLLSTLKLLANEDKLLICGQKSSHCNGFDVLEFIDDLLSVSNIRAENVIFLKDGELTQYVLMNASPVMQLSYL